MGGATGLPPLTTTLPGPDDGDGAIAIEHLVLICVHSHARFVGEASLPAIRAKFGNPATCLVSIPCCANMHPEKDIGSKPQVEYDDECIFSAKRKVSIWNWPAGECT